MWMMSIGWMIGAAGADQTECAMCPEDIGKYAGLPASCPPADCESGSDDGRVVFLPGDVVAWGSLDGDVQVPGEREQVQIDLNEVRWILYTSGTITTRSEIEAWLDGTVPGCKQ